MSEYIFTPLDLSTVSGMGISIISAIVCGIIFSIVYKADTDKPSKHMIVTLLILPAVVQAVIMLVNGSIGTGVAVAGAFSLIRFRSLPGNSRDICILFCAMAAGIAAGTGFIGYGLMFTIIIAVILILAEKLIPSEYGKLSRQLRLLIPEDMNYSEAFDDIFSEYTSHHTLNSVKTVQMGTMFELTFIITLKNASNEKQMIDKIRCRNGNLTVKCELLPTVRDEL